MHFPTEEAAVVPRPSGGACCHASQEEGTPQKSTSPTDALIRVNRPMGSNPAYEAWQRPASVLRRHECSPEREEEEEEEEDQGFIEEAVGKREKPSGII